jgi:hypothetical protein
MLVRRGSDKMGDVATHRETLCFSYEVKMVIQILAENEEQARSKLDVDGGFISRREVTLKDAVPVFSGIAEESE